MKKFIVTAASILLTACASNIVPMDHGTYMISKSSRGGIFSSSDGPKAYVYEKANEYCAKKSLQVETIKFETHKDRPLASNTELQFKCVPISN